MAIKVEFGFAPSGQSVTYNDITSDVISVNITRGKDPQQDTFNAATCSVQLNNQTRNYDPDYGASPYQGLILPTGSLKIYSFDQLVFTGVITDWNFSYSPSGQSQAEIVAADAFWNLNNQTLTSYTPTEQLSSERITSVLARPEVGGTAVWSATNRVISTGQAIVGDYEVSEGTNVLSYLQEIEKSESGRLFIDKSGRIVFKSRNNDLDNPSYEYTRVNLSPNPSFQNDVRSWEVSSGTLTRSTAESYISPASGSLSAGGAVSQYFASDFGFEYTASIYAKASSGTVSISLSGLTSAGTVYSTTNTTSAEITSSDWTRIDTTFTAVSPNSGIRIEQSPTSNAVFIDATLIERTAIVDAYFDGSNDPVYNTNDPELPDYQPERAFESYVTEWEI